MSGVDSRSTQLRDAFQILDEPGVGTLVLNREMQVTWANAYAMTILSACEEEILGLDAGSVLDTHLAPLLPGKGDAGRLLSTVRCGDEISAFDLLVQDSRGEKRRYIYSSRKIRKKPFAGMWVLCIRDITGRRPADDGSLSSNRQLQILNQIMGVSASSLSLDELLESSLSKILDLLNLDIGAIYMLNPERTAAVARYHYAVPDRYLARNRVIMVHHWPWNFVFVAGQPRYLTWCGDAGAIEEEILTSLEIDSLACIPILAESVVVGALILGRKRADAFPDEERRLLEAIGRTIGSGVLRSMLHKQLEAAHREANLYLDVMTHDIKNAENVANLYCDLLIGMLEGDAAKYAKKVQASVRKSTDILQNVSIIRHIHQESPDLRPVSLNRAIRAGLERAPEAGISFEGAATEVWADDLLSEIFTNLVKNAVTFGGPDTRIVIRVEHCPDEEHAVVVAVEDTGPGIPDDMKETIFHRSGQGMSRRCGEGLGLYIVGMLVERYGGQIRVEDRISGNPDLGASFKLTLHGVMHEKGMPPSL